MKIRIGDLKRIIKEELTASSARRVNESQALNEAGDVELYYSKFNKVPPALQKAALFAAGKALWVAERQIRVMVARAKATNSSYPPILDQLAQSIDDFMTLFADSAEAVETTIKKQVRKPANVPGPEDLQGVLAPAAERQAAAAAGRSALPGALSRALAPEFEDI